MMSPFHSPINLRADGIIYGARVVQTLWRSLTGHFKFIGTKPIKAPLMVKYFIIGAFVYTVTIASTSAFQQLFHSGSGRYRPMDFGLKHCFKVFLFFAMLKCNEMQMAIVRSTINEFLCFFVMDEFVMMSPFHLHFHLVADCIIHEARGA